jgi:hypothetical protein
MCVVYSHFCLLADIGRSREVWMQADCGPGKRSYLCWRQGSLGCSLPQGSSEAKNANAPSVIWPEKTTLSDKTFQIPIQTDGESPNVNKREFAKNTGVSTHLIMFIDSLTWGPLGGHVNSDEMQ